MDILSLSSLLKSVRNTPYPVMLANFATLLALTMKCFISASITPESETIIGLEFCRYNDVTV